MSSGSNSQKTEQSRPLLKMWFSHFMSPRPFDNQTIPERANLFTSLLMILFLISGVSALIQLGLRETPVIAASLAMCLALLLGLVRIGLYQVAVWLTLILVTCTSLAYLFFQIDISVLTTSIAVGFIAILLALLFTRTMTVFVVTLTNILIVFFIWGTVSDGSTLTFTSYLAYSLVICLLTLLVAYYQEQDRQTWQQQAQYHADEAGYLRDLLDQLPTLVAVTQEGRITYINSTGKTLMHTDNDETLIGQSMTNFLSDDNSDSDTYMRRDATSPYVTITYEQDLRRSDGKTIPVEVATTNLTYQQRPATLITARKTPTPAIAFAGTPFTAEQINLPCFITRNAQVIYMNRAAEIVTGYRLKDIRLQKFAKLLNASRYTTLSEDALAQRFMPDYRMDGDYQFVHRSGQSIQLRLITQRLDEVADKPHFLHIGYEIPPGQADIQDDIKERYQLVTRLMSGYAYMLEVHDDGTTLLRWLEGAYQTITGYDEPYIKQHNGLLMGVIADDVPLLNHGIRTLRKGEAKTMTYRIQHADGSIRWLHNEAQPVWGHQQQRVIAIYGIVHDVSERMQMDETLKTHLVKQAVVAELGMLALSSETSSGVLEHAIVLAEQVLELELCDLWEYNVASQTLTLVSSNYDASALSDRSFKISQKQTVMTHAIMVGEPVSHRWATKPEKPITASDTQDTKPRAIYDRFPDLPDHRITNSVTVLIYGSDEPFGVLNVYDTQHRTFSNDDIYFLQSIANVVGATIEQRRAQQSEIEQRDFADALREAVLMVTSNLDLDVVLDKILEFCAQVIPGHDASSIMLHDINHDAYRFARYRNHGDVSDDIRNRLYTTADLPILSLLLTQKRPIILNDVQQEPTWIQFDSIDWIQSHIGAPIIFEDACIGIINIDSTRAHAFTQTDVDRLQAFASNAGIAIHNARLAEELEHKVQTQTQALQRERAQLQIILDSTGEGIFYAENDIIQFVNDALCALTGYPYDALVGQTGAILQPEPAAMPADMGFDNETQPPRFVDLLNRVRAGAIVRDEVQIRRYNGDTFYAGVTISRIEDESSETTRHVVLLRDVSEKRQLESHKRQFIADAAHELRTPITNLSTRLYLIRKQPEKMDEHVRILNSVITRMNRLVSNLLDLSSFENHRAQLNQEMIILQDNLGDVVRVQQAEADKKNIAFAFDAPLNPVQILGDWVRLQQVFTNLIINAINYTDEGGRVGVTMTKDSETVIITVADTGRGISPDDLQYIFVPFYRAKSRQPEQKGTGLGLSISREIIMAHGGDIRVESELGIGSSFIITLPILTDDAATNV